MKLPRQAVNYIDMSRMHFKLHFEAKSLKLACPHQILSYDSLQINRSVLQSINGKQLLSGFYVSEPNKYVRSSQGHNGFRAQVIFLMCINLARVGSVLDQ